MLKASNIFSRNLQAYESGKYRVICNYGGARSGKTYSILQLLLYIAISSEKPLLISVVSQSLPHLKRGAMRDFDNIISTAGLIEGKDYTVNKTDNIYHFNVSKIEFFSSDTPAKVLGPQRDILFINECNAIEYQIYTQLDIRTAQCIFLDFNPAAKFWYNDHIQQKEDTFEIHSTYKDNPFLSDEQVKSIESHKDNESWWRVYGLGLQGRIEGMIYDYELVDEIPEGGVEVIGMDFGFVADPTAIVRCIAFPAKKEVYVEELCYGHHMLNSDIVNKLINCQIDRRTDIFADCSEMKSIAEIHKAGFNIKPCTKGGGIDRLLFQIQWMQGWKIYLVKKSNFSNSNLINELDNYIWEKDLDGRPINKPIDKFNHLLDAMRYALFTKFGKQGTGQYSIGFNKY